MRQWEETALGNIASFRNGVNYSKDNFGNGVKVINVKDFQDYIAPIYADLGQIDPSDVVRAEHLLDEGDIIFVRSNGNRELIGRSMMLLSKPVEPITHSAFTIRARFYKTTSVYPRFYAYVFRSGLIRQILSAHGSGANIANLNQDVLATLTVPLPPVDVQRRIAGILSAYDDLIENDTRRIAILEEMARRLYEEWFVHFRFPGHEAAPFVDTPYGLLPEGWSIQPLDLVCARITDGAHHSPPSVDKGLPMASVKDMHHWGLDLAGCRRICREDFDNLVRNSCRPLKNDILIAKDGANLNKHTILVDVDLDVVLLSSIAILRPGPAVRPEFLVTQLKSDEVSSAIKRMRSGAAIPRIVLRDFKRLNVLVPSMEMQQRWEATAGAWPKLCRALVRQNDNLRTQRDLVLPKLISGEIDVSAAEQAFPVAAE